MELDLNTELKFKYYINNGEARVIINDFFDVNAKQFGEILIKNAENLDLTISLQEKKF